MGNSGSDNSAIIGFYLIRVTSYAAAASNSGTFAIVYSTGTTRPDISDSGSEPEIWPPVNAAELKENVWTNGNVTGVKEELWYSIDVTEGTTYRIWWNETGTLYGDGTKTGDVVVGARYEDGDFIFGASGSNFSNTVVDSGWSTPQSFTAASSGMVYVMVTSYSTSTLYLGTFGIVYSTGSTRPFDMERLIGKWYLVDGEAYDFRPDGSLFIMGEYFGVTYTVNGNTISVSGWGDKVPGTATLAVSGSGSSAGLIISNADVNIVLINGKYSRHRTVPLTQSSWTIGTVTSLDVPILYSINVVSGMRYYIWVDDKNNSTNMTTADVGIMLYDSDGTAIWSTPQHNIWTTPAAFNATSSGTVYIGVAPYYTTGSTGLFRIAYSMLSLRP